MPLRIDFISRDFPASYHLGDRTLSTSWDDLIWAAITIGRPNTKFVFQNGQSSLYEAIFRLSLIRMAITQGPYGRLFRTSAFASLDPTEKGAVSYFLGMTLCKLFASRYLDTPWLLHLDVFRDSLNPSLLGRSRPDLLGQDNSGKWHAFESKGRSTKPSYEDKRKAKAQAQRLISVDGTPCTLHVGTFAYFTQNQLEFYWRDPEPEDPDKLEPIATREPEGAWRFYYEPALQLASLATRDALSKTAGISDTSVEIFPDIHDLLESGKWNEARTYAIEHRASLKEAGYQVDGLRVIAGTSWRDELEFEPM